MGTHMNWHPEIWSQVLWNHHWKCLESRYVARVPCPGPALIQGLVSQLALLPWVIPHPPSESLSPEVVRTAVYCWWPSCSKHTSGTLKAHGLRVEWEPGTPVAFLPALASVCLWIPEQVFRMWNTHKPCKRSSSSFRTGPGTFFLPLTHSSFMYLWNMCDAYICFSAVRNQTVIIKPSDILLAKDYSH